MSNSTHQLCLIDQSQALNNTNLDVWTTHICLKSKLLNKMNSTKLNFSKFVDIWDFLRHITHHKNRTHAAKSSKLPFHHIAQMKPCTDNIMLHLFLPILQHVTDTTLSNSYTMNLNNIKCIHQYMEMIMIHFRYFYSFSYVITRNVTHGIDNGSQCF